MTADGLTGVDGEVLLNGTLIGNIDMWKFKLKSKTERVSGFGTRIARKKPSLIDGDGDASGIWSRGDAAGQGALVAAMLNQTEQTLTLATDRLDPDPWVLPVFISDVEEGSKLEGNSDFKFSFTLAGEPLSVPSHA